MVKIQNICTPKNPIKYEQCHFNIMPTKDAVATANNVDPDPTALFRVYNVCPDPGLSIRKLITMAYKPHQCSS